MGVYVPPSDANLQVSDITTNDVSSSAHGFAPKVWASAWATWTPTWTNLTVGNGTLDFAHYIQIGKFVHFQLQFTLGTTSSVGTNPIFSLPVTALTGIPVTSPMGVGTVEDVGSAVYVTQCVWVSTTTARALVQNASGTYLTEQSITATVPFTFGSTDIYRIQGTYEAA